MVILGNGPLPPFIAAAGKRPFTWGSWDCLMWLAEWVRERRGVDPGAGHRRRYSNALGAARIVARAGGMVAHVDSCVLSLGIERLSDPRAGDIAVVDGPDGEIGALVLGSGSTVSLSDAGTLIVPVRVRPILAAWRV